MNTQELQIILQAVSSVSGDAREVLYAYLWLNALIAALWFSGFCLFIFSVWSAVRRASRSANAKTRICEALGLQSDAGVDMICGKIAAFRQSETKLASEVEWHRKRAEEAILKLNEMAGRRF